MADTEVEAKSARPRPIDPADERLLESALARLRATGRIEFRGEFGNEIATFIPFIAWLHAEGQLEGRQVVSYRAMRPFYFFLDEGQLVEKDEVRMWEAISQRDWPSNSTYTATRAPWHRPPDYRAHYLPRARRFALPTLFIQNKFSVEWDIGPVNYVPIASLETLLKLSQGRFQVVYSRPGAMPPGADYSLDGNTFCQYPDLEVLRRYPEALILEDMAKAEGRAYNELKLEVLAGTHLFFAVQGGSAHILAAFGNSVLAVIHRDGPEFPHAYQYGPYTYLATPRPRLIVMRTTKEIEEAVALFSTIDVREGRIVARDFGAA